MTSSAVAVPTTTPIPTAASTYLTLASLAFALLGLEIVLLMLEPVAGMAAGGVGASLAHWFITIVLWVSGSLALALWARRHTEFTLRGEGSPSNLALRSAAIVALIVMTLAAQWILRGGMLPPFAEYAAFSDRFGDAGLALWLVQVVYYVAEVGVMVLIIAFGQRAGERWFALPWIPWGGIVLALSWGLVHFLTQDAATGVYGIALALIMGSVFVLARRSLLVSFPLLVVMFVV